MKSTTLCALLVLAVSLSVTCTTTSLLVRDSKSHSKTWVKVASSPVQVRRYRKASMLTRAERKEALDRHNALRAGEGANNMELMVCIAHDWKKT